MKLHIPDVFVVAILEGRMVRVAGNMERQYGVATIVGRRRTVIYLPVRLPLPQHTVFQVTLEVEGARLEFQTREEVLEEDIAIVVCDSSGRPKIPVCEDEYGTRFAGQGLVTVQAGLERREAIIIGHELERSGQDVQVNRAWDWSGSISKIPAGSAFYAAAQAALEKAECGLGCPHVHFGNTRDRDDD